MSEDQHNTDEASGSTGDSGRTGGNHSKNPDVNSNTPESTVGKLNPSAPGNAGTTPGSNAEKRLSSF